MNHRFPAVFQRKQFKLVGSNALIHVGIVAQQEVLPVHAQGEQAVPAHMGLGGLLDPEDDLPLTNTQLIPLRLILNFRAPDGGQLQRLRHAVPVEIVIAFQQFRGLLQHNALHDAAAGKEAAAVGVLLLPVSAAAQREGQVVVIQPLIPVLRQEYVFRDPLAVRQFQIPVRPVRGLKDPDLVPRPSGVGQKQIVPVRGPAGLLTDVAAVLPQGLPRRRIHDPQEFRRPHTADQKITGAHGPDLKAPVRGLGVALHLRHRGAVQQLLIGVVFRFALLYGFLRHFRRLRDFRGGFRLLLRDLDLLLSGRLLRSLLLLLLTAAGQQQTEKQCQNPSLFHKKSPLFRFL